MRARAPLAIGAATVAATVLVALVDPNEPGHYPLCPTKALTGLDCPACGGLRAVHALTHGDLLGAVDHNVLVVALLPVAVLLWVAWLRRAWHTTADAPWSAVTAGLLSVAGSRPAVVTLLAVMLGFTVLRNVGGVPALAWLGSAAAVV